MTMPRRAGFLALAGFVGMVIASRLAAQTEGAIAGRVRESGTDRSLGGAQVLVDERVGAVTRHRRALPRPRRPDRMASRGRAAHRLSRRRARQRVRARRRHRHGRLRARGERGRAGAARGYRPGGRAARSAGHQHRAEDHRGRPARPAGQLARRGHRAERRERRTELSGRPDRRGVVHPRRAWASRTSSTPRTAGSASRIPPDLLGEASLVTNGFSARYGQALSGLVNVVTRDPGERGRAAAPSRPTVRSAAGSTTAWTASR